MEIKFDNYHLCEEKYNKKNLPELNVKDENVAMSDECGSTLVSSEINETLTLINDHWNAL
jgi:hypothetical protein